MSTSNINLRKPREIIFEQQAPDTAAPKRLRSSAPSQTPLLIKGQGVFIFKPKDVPTEQFETTIRFTNEAESVSLELTISFNKFHLLLRKSDGTTFTQEKNIALSTNDKAFYWMSLDSHNHAFRFGLGEARLETQMCLISFENDKETTTDLLSLSQFAFDRGLLHPMRMLRDPIVLPVALKVKGPDDLTMNDIAENEVMPKANLTPIGQLLYENVSGKKFVLNDDDFPEFSEAIEHSIRTPGCWCYNTLDTKSQGKPDGQKKKIYLRITLGQNSGESPGVPYVMEIWPPGCYSSIHSHAGANAIIRVLSGEIHVTMYPFLGTTASFDTKSFSKDDITWISPTLNQYHHLKNENLDGPTCITIQCYMYDADDLGHYSYFDYIDDNDKLAQFNPNSDMDFVAFKALMKEEWGKRG